MINLQPKLKHRLILWVCFAGISLSFVAFAHAHIRPPNPTMDYVPQNVGIYDTYYHNFKESDCRACHETTMTAWRHHATEYAVRGQCAATCHIEPNNPVINPEKDCKVCHNDGTWVPIDIGYGVGNLGNPHHRSQYAAAGSCTACHLSTLISEINTIEPPQYIPTSVTPTPFSCENCHWPSGIAAHTATTYPDQVGDESVEFFNDWNQWSGFPKPTTWPDSLPRPQPIEAHGAVLSGDLNTSKPYRPLDGTHHEIGGEVYPNCYWCHGTNPDTDPSWDPTDPYLIRMCENCHDIYTIHDSAGEGVEHTTDGIGGLGLFGGYTVGGILDQVVLTNMKCVACHVDVIGLIPQDPRPGQLLLGYLEPPMGSPGIEVAIYDDSGNADFGNQGPDDTVQMFDGSAWVDVPVVSWTPNKIEFLVDGLTFTANAMTGVRVLKKYWVETLGDSIGNEDHICDPGEACYLAGRASDIKNFFIRNQPVLSSLSPDSGTWGTVVTINAMPQSFFIKREEILPGTNYGYSTYVEFVASNYRYRVTEMTGSGWAGDAALGGWSDTAIQIRLASRNHPTKGIVGNLLDVNMGDYVTLDDLYKGNWQLYVITDYFKDDGDGMYMEHLGGVPTGHLTGKIDAGDTLLYRVISDPLPWFATDTPYISHLHSNVVKGDSLAAVYGINFGTIQDTSTIWGRNASGTVAVPLTVVQWENTRVVFRTPVVSSTKAGYIQVRVPKVLPPGNKNSNLSPQITIYP